MRWLVSLLYTFSLCLQILAKDLPWCVGNSVCGYVQKHRQGIVRLATCNCRHSNCPMDFNYQEQIFLAPHHIKEQYKYCNGPVDIPKCEFLSDNRPAFIHFEYLNHHREVIAYKDEMRCECPKRFSYEVMNTERVSGPNITMVITKYNCVKIPICSENSVYQEITDLAQDGGLLLDPKCIAPSREYCPFKALETPTQDARMALTHGKIYIIRCKSR
ncbi:U-scoloptoxin(11)-Sm7a-like [Tigriopus californicus]|uniref:U-scoloptoxin(11)-Sm7a-like n=1 Tax=Tigriopus californicus TaxID=6832 RepID=UPI0027D9D76A|nr:U-scoloptoxin(11)-Sm7a-like [Tigriopus californicus]